MPNKLMCRLAGGVAACTLFLGTARVNAQLVPWRVFADPDSASVCDLVNAANAELVVLLNSDTLTIVTGTDTELVNTEVANDGEVFISNLSFGFIEFATDADGFRTLWWVSITGRVMEVNGITGTPRESEFFPEDFANVPCDACPFWDDGTICTCILDRDCDDFDECTLDNCDPLGGCEHIEIFCDDDDSCTDDVCDPNEGCIFAEVVCDDNNPCTDEACLGGDCVVVDLDEACDDGDECTVDDLCIDGECLGIEVSCDDDDPCTEDACDPDRGCIFAEIVCDDENECTDETCVAGRCVFVETTDRCDDGDECTADDRCDRGECLGELIADCDDDGGGGPVIVLCGPNAALTMTLTFAGLIGAGALRRRRAAV